MYVYVHERGDKEVVSKKDLSVAQENDRLRRESRILKDEREILKKGNAVLRVPKALRFKLIEEHSESFLTNRLFDITGVSPRGLRAFRNRPTSRRQRSDLVTLAHIKEQSRFSLGSYALHGS